MRRSLTAFFLLIAMVAGTLEFSREGHVWAGLSQAPAQKRFDRYGGLLSTPCTNRTGHFIFTKLGNRWWYCTPAEHVFIAMSVGNILPNGNPTVDCNDVNVYPIYAAKYGAVDDPSGTGTSWGEQSLKRLKAWGFNSVGQDSVGDVMPWQTCSKCSWPSRKQPIPLPYLMEARPAEYAAVNRFDYLKEPIKDEITGTNNSYSTWRGGALFDIFDPKLDTEWQKELQANKPGMNLLRSNYPYLLGVLTDDSDWFTGAGAGPDFATGKTAGNVAWITLITSPVRTYVQNPPYASKQSFLYQDSLVYTKALATNPLVPCSISSPCSLRDYLWQKYQGNVVALNKTWGSNYTTFDSSGKQIRGESIGTGDGVTRVFDYRLTHTLVSPYTVLVYEGKEVIAGDCPWFHKGCGKSENEQGTISGPFADLVVQSSSSINYSSGQMSISFASAPRAGTQLHVDYIYDGWMAGGTGLMDEDGSHTKWVGTNVWCLEGPNPYYPSHFACTGSRGIFEPEPNANPLLGADLDTWVAQWSARFFKTMHDDLRKFSKVPYLGLDVIGGYGAPPYSKLLQGAAPYLDGAFTGGLHYWQPLPSPTVFTSAYQYFTRYVGDKPFMTFSVITATKDSSYYCKGNTNTPNDFASQEERGKAWYNQIKYLLTTESYNRDIQAVGFNWWSWQDFQDLNQGLISLRDNTYDGHEDVAGSVTCSSPLQPLTCGGEAHNYGDLITLVRNANNLWPISSDNNPK